MRNRGNTAMTLKELKGQVLMSLKGVLLLMGYCLFITLFTWGGMLLVSFIPFMREFVGEGPETLFDLTKLVNFWMGTITGILSLFVVAALKGGTLGFELQRSEESAEAES